MKAMARTGRLVILCIAAFGLAACAGQKEPARKLLAEIDASVTAASVEAAKYIPDQLIAVQRQAGELKAAFDKHDYPAVVHGGPAVLAAAQTLATAAAFKKDEVLKAMNDQWTVLAGAVPEYLTAIQKQIDFLRKKSNQRLAAGIDLDAAKSGAEDTALLWSKAQAAFASGSMEEAVRTAQEVKSRVEALAATLKLDLSAPVASS
ncbi:MAG: hypothetical protein M3O26_10300 [Pseudomonadota bacterium]|nr:hypothetical protein [Pseudomonadota bacterium]